MKRSRQPWTKKVKFTQEDEAICLLVEELGSHSWSLLSSKLKSDFGIMHRSGKQCRERWHNHLDPSIQKEPWTESEEKILFEMQAVHGNCWAEIAKHLPGRTDNAVKNHYYGTMRKILRHKGETPQDDSQGTAHTSQDQLYEEVNLLLYLQQAEYFYVPKVQSIISKK